MPKAVGGEPRVGFDQRRPIGMAIEVLPEGVPAGFQILSVEDPDRQLDQPAAAHRARAPVPLQRQGVGSADKICPQRSMQLLDRYAQVHVLAGSSCPALGRGSMPLEMKELLRAGK